MKSETDVTKNVFDSDSELIFNYFKMSANTIFSFFVEYFLVKKRVMCIRLRIYNRSTSIL